MPPSLRWALALTVFAATVAAACSSSDDPPRWDPLPPLDYGVAPEPTDASAFETRTPIKHVVFVIKENRTFDHMFGRFPGADGARFGFTCDGDRVKLQRATPKEFGADHSFVAGLTAVNGGKMNCFDAIRSGSIDRSYNQYARADIPNYWRYAERFALADRFFSSVYGPTG
ncbi:MAG TPA: alkaline phosphatase family protein, partial [Actinomycetota bacterium]|nr:alkaline phosphatase family protein [Actinomycetota bacterium]